MNITDDMLKELLKDCKTADDITGKDGLLRELTSRLLTKAMEGEMEHHLGYAKHSKDGYNSGNSRNGKYKKTVKSEIGNLEVTVPRDRNGEFEPEIIKKNDRRFRSFNEQIISMYSHGMTQRNIKSHLKEMYGVDVSPELISSVTDAVISDVKEWQARPLEELYLILYLDALVLKVRDEGQVINKAVYIALGVRPDGIKEVLGIWIQKTEGAKFWMHVLTEIKNRGTKDVLVACVDGLTGFEQAIEAVYPKTRTQLCIVHLVRSSLRFVSWKDRRAMAADLKLIYRAATEGEAKTNLINFKEKWDEKYPLVGQDWERKWERFSNMFGYPEAIRRVIYTTNAIESLNSQLRKITKSRPSFPNDQAVEKLLFLAIRRISTKWTMPLRDWGEAINQFAILFEDRLIIN